MYPRRLLWTVLTSAQHFFTIDARVSLREVQRCSCTIASSHSAALTRVHVKQKEELDKLTTEYVLLEETYYDHIDGVVYEILDGGTKSAFTRKPNENNKLLTELVVEFEKAKKIFDTTLSLVCPPACNIPAGSTTMTMPRVPTVKGRIAQLPQLDTINDAYEFLWKLITLLESQLIPEERWYAALLYCTIKLRPPMGGC